MVRNYRAINRTADSLEKCTNLECVRHRLYWLLDKHAIKECMYYDKDGKLFLNSVKAYRDRESINMILVTLKWGRRVKVTPVDAEIVARTF